MNLSLVDKIWISVDVWIRPVFPDPVTYDEIKMCDLEPFSKIQSHIAIPSNLKSVNFLYLNNLDKPYHIAGLFPEVQIFPNGEF